MGKYIYSKHFNTLRLQQKVTETVYITDLYFNITQNNDEK